MAMRSWVLLLSVVSACGPSAAQVKEAREAAYQTEFANVWNAVSAEMHESFPDAVKVENPNEGYAESKWKTVELKQEETLGDSNSKTNTQASPTGAREMFRLMAKIEPGGPPWRIAVDGEAARYTPGMSVLNPYKHGAVDEPPWVSARIDAFRMSVHERLKQYAVQPPAARTP